MKELTNVECRDRENIELSVRATGIPKPTVVWLKNDEVIKEDERHAITTHVDGIVDSTYSVTTFGDRDVGTIKVRATNVAGSAETACQLKMELISPAFGHALPRSAQVNEGEPLELKAKVDGSPIPEIAWFKDGEKIVPDDHIKIETLPDGTTKLTIDCVKPTDCGAYKLVVSNSTGEQSSLCAVAIKREYNFSLSISFLSHSRKMLFSLRFP